MEIKIRFGGSCHWCTEAISQSLKEVIDVQQGWISAIAYPSFSEDVVVNFDPQYISLKVLIEIHLRTHSSSSTHRMRERYRSSIYTFSEEQFKICSPILDSLRGQFEKPLITQVYHDSFKLNTENNLNSYRNNPDKSFCKHVIAPKLRKLREEDHSAELIAQNIQYVICLISYA